MGEMKRTMPVALIQHFIYPCKKELTCLGLRMAAGGDAFGLCDMDV